MNIFTGQAGMKLNVDKAFCLSLREAENRRAYLKSEFEKINQDVEFILNDRSHNPQKAISKSHQDLCRMASENNWETVLIFEDDVRFYDFNPIQIAQINFFLDQNKTWDMFYLGGILGKMWKTESDGITRIRCAGTHSYIVHKRAFERVLEIDYEKTEKAVDSVYKKKFKLYSPYPLMTRQEDNCILGSSIQGYRDQVTGSKGKLGEQEKMWRKNRIKERQQVYFKNLHKWLFKLDQ
ncbi:MAG: hypothetical protein V7717_04190 [Porticoccaceae bacterium]